MTMLRLMSHRTKGKKSVSVDVDPEFWTGEFENWVKSMQRSKTAAVDAALRLAMKLPLELREMIFAGEWDKVAELLFRLQAGKVAGRLREKLPARTPGGPEKDRASRQGKGRGKSR
jgi:hypothetical protein